MHRPVRLAPLLALAVAALATLSACGGGAAPAPTCADGLRNGEETAVDCGGPACPPCADGQACAAPGDCRSGVCAPGAGGPACAPPTCGDAVKNGGETNVDCGGPDCPRCADGLACQVDGDCLSGRCTGGTCARALGAGCGAGAECASGACVDGVCCESACDGTCEACNLPGRFGHCDPVPDGEDPAAECAAEAASTCGQDGACSGGRTCRRWAAGTACQPAACLDPATAQPGASCDGAGACVPPAPVACAPLTCDAAGGACRTACADSTQCAAGYGCASGGGCLKLDGAACAADGECLHGFCTDGVCCEARCDGACEACDQAGRAGRCDPIPAGQDPAEECAATGAATCGTTGACSGARACALWSGATSCAAASCDSETISRPASLCSGAGACLSQGTVDCAPLRCDAATGACRLTCAGDGDCAPGYSCAGGACQRPLGAACQAGVECGSGLCVDGVCCGSACAGTCQACNLPGTAGTCAAVPAGQDPGNECADQGAASCGTTGACSGTGSCARYPAGTTCAAASCSAGSSTAARTCDGSGTCGAATPTSCFPFTCNAATGLCVSTCNRDADCAAGYGCAADGGCRKRSGQACAAAGECLNFQCFDGYCCDAACSGTCQACNVPGLIGTCSPTPLGQAQVGECPADACHLGTCDGAGACRLAPAGTPCGTGLACDAAGACLDVNECQSGTATCDANATCTNTTGGYTCACNLGWVGSGTSCRRPVSCKELQQAAPGSPSGLYVLDPDGAGGLPEFQASCDMTTDGGGWTVFQRRQDATDFDRTFAEYQAGFGAPAGSFWLGLDRLVAMTATARELRVEMDSAVKNPDFVKYSTFTVGPGPGYQLHVAGPSLATDGFTYHDGMLFTAKDLDQDPEPTVNCAVFLKGGGWFNKCHLVNINGPYITGPDPSGAIVSWYPYGGSLSNGLVFLEMKLR